MRTSHSQPSCGILNTITGPEFIVAGGEDSDVVEIFNLDSGTWRYGANLPEVRLGAAGVSYHGTLVIAGGVAEGDDFYDNVIEYDIANDRWKRRNEKLSLPRFGAAAVLVSEDIVDCS